MKLSGFFHAPIAVVIFGNILVPNAVDAAVTTVSKGFGETAECSAQTAVNQVCTSAGSEDCGFGSDKGHILQCDDEGE